jgi:hypothetical protein
MKKTPNKQTNEQKNSVSSHSCLDTWVLLWSSAFSNSKRSVNFYFPMPGARDIVGTCKYLLQHGNDTQLLCTFWNSLTNSIQPRSGYTEENFSHTCPSNLLPSYLDVVNFIWILLDHLHTYMYINTLVYTYKNIHWLYKQRIVMNNKGRTCCLWNTSFVLIVTIIHFGQKRQSAQRGSKLVNGEARVKARFFFFYHITLVSATKNTNNST